MHKYIHSCKQRNVHTMNNCKGVYMHTFGYRGVGNTVNMLIVHRSCINSWISVQNNSVTEAVYSY